MKIIRLEEGKIEINGLPWYEHNGKQLHRLPAELEAQVSKDVWELSRSTAGVRLRFRTDSTYMGMRVRYHYRGNNHNFSIIGRYGASLYVDGHYWNSFYPGAELENEWTLFKDMDAKSREIVIYLPNYSSIDVECIMLDDAAEIKAPSSFSLSKPVVFYGTSITQGGCASHPGLSYQALLCRDLNIDFVNLGFSGCGKGEACIAAAIAQIDASCYVLDFSQNNASPEELEGVYLPFIEEIRKVRKEIPIILISAYYSTQEQWDKARLAKNTGLRRVVREAYDKCIHAGDRNIYHVEGTSLITPEDTDCFVDGVHPNDLGFLAISSRLKDTIRKVCQIGMD